MDRSLVAILVEKGVIRAGTELFSRCNALCLGGSPCLMDLPIKVRSITDELTFIGYYNSKNWIIKCDQILKVDGMNPDRLASAFDLKVNGNKKELGKKRGRKTKHQIRKYNESDFNSNAIVN